MKTRWMAAVLGMALAGPALRADEGPTDKVKERLGPEILKILKGVDKAEAFRIEARAAKPDEKETIGGHPIKATASAALKEEFIKKLTAALTDEKTLFGQQARCFLPGVAFRLTSKDKETVEVLVCFGCKNLTLIARDDKGKVVKEAKGAFGPEIKPLLDLVLVAFPDDKELKELKEKP
jgi:hypothetical protein